MRSLKITLTLTALVAVFLLTVSGQSLEVVNESEYSETSIEANKNTHKTGFAAIEKKGKDRPGNA